MPDSPDLKSKELLQRAEAALRQAVSSNKTVHIADKADQVQSRPNLALLPRIERAIEHGEFVLYYQPKISAAFKTVIGAEGLVRWHDADENVVVSPDQFIDTVEASDLIVPLTEA